MHSNKNISRGGTMYRCGFLLSTISNQ